MVLPLIFNPEFVIQVYHQRNTRFAERKDVCRLHLTTDSIIMSVRNSKTLCAYLKGGTGEADEKQEAGHGKRERTGYCI